MNFDKLKEPFPASDIEWRVQSSGGTAEKPWALVLAYVQARAIQERLDSVCGAENWKDVYQHLNDGVMCGLSIKIGEEWVEKWNGSPETEIESFKGGISKAFVRCASSGWGIGRYLYRLETAFASILPTGQRGKHKDSVKDKTGKFLCSISWNDPNLPAWALPPSQPPEPGQTGKATTEEIPAEASSGSIAEYKLICETQQRQLGWTNTQATDFRKETIPDLFIKNYTKDEWIKLSEAMKAEVSKKFSLCQECDQPGNLSEYKGRMLCEDCFAKAE